MEFKDCKNSDDILSFFRDPKRAFKHTNYYHYTTLHNANSILTENAFRLTRLSVTANDNIEKERYKKIGSNVFSLCFSTGTSENLPLWYLYSGIDGKGVRIGLKKKIFLMLCNLKVSLAETEPVSPYIIKGEPIALAPDDYDFSVQDILYLGKDPAKHNYYRAKYNGQVINGLSEDTYTKINTQYLFIKSLIWFYEKETRIQVEIKNEALLKPDTNYVVLLDFSEISNKLSIKFAPEFGDITSDAIDDYVGIKNWLILNIEKSDFAGQIKMNLKERLCEDCRNGNS